MFHKTYLRLKKTEYISNPDASGTDGVIFKENIDKLLDKL